MLQGLDFSGMGELKVSLQGSEGGGMNVQGLPPCRDLKTFLAWEKKNVRKNLVGAGKHVPVFTPCFSVLGNAILRREATTG